jgi:hypothetical protein
MPHVYCRHNIYSRHEDAFIYVNIANNYQRKLIEDIESHVNYDGD